MCFNFDIVIDMWTLDASYVNILFCDALDCIVFELGVLIWCCIALIGEVMWPCKSPKSPVVSCEFEEWTWRSNSKTNPSQNKSAYQCIFQCAVILHFFDIIPLLTAYHQHLRIKRLCTGTQGLGYFSEMCNSERYSVNCFVNVTIFKLTKLQYFFPD